MPEDAPIVWTTAALTVTQRRIDAPSAAGEREYGTRYSKVRYELPWSGSAEHSPLEAELFDSVCRLAGQRRMIVLLSYDAAGANMEQVRLAVCNGILVDCKRNEHFGLAQWHIWPLCYYPFIAKLYRVRTAEELLRNGMEVWVNSLVYPFEQVCGRCPHKLDRVFELCGGMSPACRCKSYPFRWRHAHDTLEWFDTHALNVEALQSVRALQYVPIVKCSTHRDFDPITFKTLSPDNKHWEQEREYRSAKSTSAAQTTRMRTRLCRYCVDGTFRGETWCSRCGDNRCRGLLMLGELDKLAEKCNPWMVYALFIANKRTLARAETEQLRRSKFRGTRLPIYAVGPSHANSKRAMEFVASGLSRQHWNCLCWLDMLELLRLPDLKTWEEVCKWGAPLPPSWHNRVPAWYKALAYLIAGGKVNRVYRRSGWGNCTTLHLEQVRGMEVVNLRYVSGYNADCCTVEDMGSLYRLSNHRASAEWMREQCLSYERKLENRLLSKIVGRLGYNLDIHDVRKYPGWDSEGGRLESPDEREWKAAWERFELWADKFEKARNNEKRRLAKAKRKACKTSESGCASSAGQTG
jgi:hypothetical protein